MKWITIYFFLFCVALAVAGCATDGTVQSVEQDVCPALVGPITYNSHNHESDWFAGKKLAPQLAKRNRVGVTLHCPAYR